MELQVSRDHYDFQKYVNKPRWTSYWHQLDEVIRLAPRNVLEIGTGPGVFKQLAGTFGLTVETLDIDPALNPDYVASVFHMPFKDNAYDVVAAFQVLEHFPYEQFPTALREIKRVAAHHVVISLPDADCVWRYSLHIPKLGEKEFYIKRPKLRQQEHVFDGEHYWEISKKRYPLHRITEELNRCGFEVVRTYRVPENTYHRFFVLTSGK